MGIDTGPAKTDYLIGAWALRSRRARILEKAGESDWFALRRRVLLKPDILPRPWSELEATMPTDMKAILAGIWHYQLVTERDDWEECVMLLFDDFSAMAYELLTQVMVKINA